MFSLLCPSTQHSAQKLSKRVSVCEREEGQECVEGGLWVSSEGLWAGSASSHELWQLLNKAGLVQPGWKVNIKVPPCGLESTEPETRARRSRGEGRQELAPTEPGQPFEWRNWQRRRALHVALRFQDWVMRRQTEASYWGDSRGHCRAHKGFSMVLALPHPKRSLSSKKYVLLKDSTVSHMMGNEILSLPEAQKTDFRVANTFHSALVLVLWKADSGNGFFNLDSWPCQSS